MYRRWVQPMDEIDEIDKINEAVQFSVFWNTVPEAELLFCSVVCKSDRNHNQTLEKCYQSCWLKYQRQYGIVKQEQPCCRVAGLYSYIGWGWCLWRTLISRTWWPSECSFWHCWHSYWRLSDNVLKHRKTTLNLTGTGGISALFRLAILWTVASFLFLL